MKLLFDLSKEHPILPTQEIISVIETYGQNYSILHSNPSVFIIDINIKSNILSILSSRLAFTHSISEFLFATHLIEEMKNYDIHNGIPRNGTIAIRYKNRSQGRDSQKIVQTLASYYTKNRRVNLDHPDHEIYAIITDKNIFVGRLINKLNRKAFDKRKVQHRPFFSPISIHPRIARALVNLAHVTPKTIILDPFCGTGGFLIEAGLIGCKLYGSDIHPKMIEGTKKNLDYYHIIPKILINSDIGKLSDHLQEHVDGIITDAPYGKSTTTKQEILEKLYHRTFETLSNILKINGYIIIGLPNKTYIKKFCQYFELKNIIIIPVHQSLTRYFYIGIKKQP
jgi:tRNA (guanine10-N2)-dimethyltransferase